MNQLIPLSQFVKSKNDTAYLSHTSVVVDTKGIPQGFIFGRDSFISLLTVIDDAFENRVTDPKKAFDNPAGKLIDLIEENLPLNPDFVVALKNSARSQKTSVGISLRDVMKTLHD